MRWMTGLKPWHSPLLYPQVLQAGGQDDRRRGYSVCRRRRSLQQVGHLCMICQIQCHSMPRNGFA